MTVSLADELSRTGNLVVGFLYTAVNDPLRELVTIHHHITPQKGCHTQYYTLDQPTIICPRIATTAFKCMVHIMPTHTGKWRYRESGEILGGIRENETQTHKHLHWLCKQVVTVIHTLIQMQKQLEFDSVPATNYPLASTAEDS